MTNKCTLLFRGSFMCRSLTIGTVGDLEQTYKRLLASGVIGQHTRFRIGRLQVRSLSCLQLKPKLNNMENLKHTPGPWELAGGDNSNFEINIGETTCSVTRYDKNAGYHQISREEMEANAKLIATAPDLLEALKAIIEPIVATHTMNKFYSTGKSWEKEILLIQSAIKKATS